MKNFFKRLSTFTTVLYIVGVIATAYILYKFPERLQSVSEVEIDVYDLHLIRHILNELYLVTGGVMLLGMLGILFLMIAERPGSDTAIDTIQTFKAKSEEEAEGQEEEENTAREYGDAMAAIDELVAGAGQAELPAVFEKGLALVANKLEAVQGAVFLAHEGEENSRYIELLASYAYVLPESQVVRFEFGEGLSGQVAKEGKLVNINSVPEGYISVLSGLGDAAPTHMLIVPLVQGATVVGVAELAGFSAFTVDDEAFAEEMFAKLAGLVSQESLT